MHKVPRNEMRKQWAYAVLWVALWAALVVGVVHQYKPAQNDTSNQVSEWLGSLGWRDSLLFYLLLAGWLQSVRADRLQSRLERYKAEVDWLVDKQPNARNQPKNRGALPDGEGPNSTDCRPEPLGRDL